MGCIIFETVTGEIVDSTVGYRFYPDVDAGTATLIWAAWRAPTHTELVRAWPTRTSPDAADLGRGWWPPTIEVLREERRRAASLERARATRLVKRSLPDDSDE